MNDMVSKIKTHPLRIMIQQFWQGHWRQMRMMSFVFALLLLFLHLFFLISGLTQRATVSVRQKLGVYFYINDVNTMGSGVTQEQVASRIVKFKDELTAGGVSVVYYSKDEALDHLQRRLPDVIKNFDQYGIDNPLPVTLYVTFQDQKQYDFVMQAKQQYEDILLGGPGADAGVQEQFERNARVIGVLHVLQGFFIFIILACTVVILVFLSMMIKTKFTSMHNTIRVHTLLGSPLWYIKKPFLYNAFVVLTIGYLMTLLLSAFFLMNISHIFPYVFGISLGEVMGGVGYLKFLWLFGEFIILLFLSALYANQQLTRLLKSSS